MKVSNWFLVVVFVLLMSVPFMAQQFYTSTAFTTAGTTNFTQLVAPVAGKAVNVIDMGLAIGAGGTTGNTVQLFSCTSTPCSTTGSTSGMTAISVAWSPATGTSIGSINLAGNPIVTTPIGGGLFVVSTAAAPYSIHVTTTQQ